MPRGNAIITDSMVAKKASSIDIQIRPPISSITDRSVTREIPKSPCGKPTIKFINCIGNIISAIETMQNKIVDLSPNFYENEKLDFEQSVKNYEAYHRYC